MSTVTIPVLLAAAFGLLVAGTTMPILTVQRFFLLTEPYSILGVIALLYRSGEVVVAAIAAAFSLLFPAVKILLLLGLWNRLRTGRPVPGGLIPFLEVVGKWSMLDILAAALLVAAAKVQTFADARFEPAACLFVGSVLLTALCTTVLKRRSRVG